MNQTEISEGLATLHRGHPFARALQAVLAEAVEMEQLGVTQNNLTDAQRHFNAGRLACVRDLQTALESLMTKSASTTKSSG